MDVKLVGLEEPLDTIIATQGGYALGGSPPPEAVEGELEEIIREWLQDKGNGSATTTGKHRQSSFPSPSPFGKKASDSTVFRNHVHSNVRNSCNGIRHRSFVRIAPTLTHIYGSAAVQPAGFSVLSWLLLVLVFK